MTVSSADTQLYTHFCTAVDQRAIRFARQLDRLLPKVMRAHNVTHYQISNKILKEVAYNAAKDIEKLKLYQENNVDELKLAGYLAFWVRKLKPVNNAEDVKGAVHDINEQASIWMIAALHTRHLKRKGKDREERRKVLSVFQALFNDTGRISYLIHSIRYRTFGPHHYVIWLREIIKV